nr:hypothetical protein [Nocardia terpenica]
MQDRVAKPYLYAEAGIANYGASRSIRSRAGFPASRYRCCSPKSSATTVNTN